MSNALENWTQNLIYILNNHRKDEEKRKKQAISKSELSSS